MIVATPPPARVAALVVKWPGVQEARCLSDGKDYVCVVKVKNGCVSAVFAFRHSQLGFSRSSARVVKCWKTNGGPKS